MVFRCTQRRATMCIKLSMYCGLFEDMCADVVSAQHCTCAEPCLPNRHRVLEVAMYCYAELACVQLGHCRLLFCVKLFISLNLLNVSSLSIKCCVEWNSLCQLKNTP